MRLILDTERCTGHGRCYALAPQLFEPDDEGYGRLLSDGDVPTELQELARKAALNCPEHAIDIVD
jgi:ferredoxin